MPRQPKPFFRKQTNSWYCSIAGRQISLGKDRESAHAKFHELMADREQVTAEVTTLYELSQAYLDWCQANRKPNTYQRHRYFLKSFIGSVGKRLRPSQLRIHQIRKWHEGLEIGTTTQNDAVGIVQRMLNWAVEQEYLSCNPIKGMKKPKRRRRDVFYTPEQWKLIRENVPGPLGDLLDFLYLTGCRPIEARSIEARHLHGDLVIFPADESKGEHEPRVIYLVPDAKAILDRLAKDHPAGALFRNQRGRPWTIDSIKCKLTRVSKTVGFRVIAYGARHSFATEALTKGGVDPISVAHLMGHKDPTMVSNA
ncbi:tyrosine-type recombinase/integrase [Blastopirellula retiformator]|uniref:Site-specific tyrosine recombinase XerC n=1 Tax=Blastopirellula retiformator TaxID=2527970 RepID=A0A5C5V8A9_9BACT|nr:tyrosine-type recombinase/integrase [Blastopirellula retiformator]TWT34806.1 site-specific tyrosine recombinase XerC [Blastopirellula retiformator]